MSDPLKVVVLVPRRGGIADRDRLWGAKLNRRTGAVPVTPPRPVLESCTRGPNVQKSTCMHEGCNAPSQVRGLCRRHWSVWNRRGWEMLPPVSRQQPVLPRWESKVERSPSCWFWTGAISRSGYGNFWTGESYVSAHRWSYEHFVGPIPEGLDLDHLCRVRNCVNPAHLEPVTRQENLRRGREARGCA